MVAQPAVGEAWQTDAAAIEVCSLRWLNSLDGRSREASNAYAGVHLLKVQ